MGKFSGLDPKKHYVCVDPSQTGVASIGHYEALGYELVLPGTGVRCVSGGKGADAAGVVNGPYGTVLMSIDNAILQERVDEGQSFADDVERRIRSKGAMDGFQSKTPDGRLSFMSEVEAPRIERGT